MANVGKQSADCRKRRTPRPRNIVIRNPEQLVFQGPVSKSRLLASLLKYVDLPYHPNTTAVAWNPRTQKWEGHGNCFGVLLLAARDEGYLPAALAQDINLPPARWGQTQAKTLWSILKLNFYRVPAKELEPCDVLLMRYSDTSDKNREPHHVGVSVAERTPGVFQFAHTTHKAGRLYVCDICDVFKPRIEQVHRFLNAVD